MNVPLDVPLKWSLKTLCTLPKLFPIFNFLCLFLFFSFVLLIFIILNNLHRDKNHCWRLHLARSNQVIATFRWRNKSYPLPPWYLSFVFFLLAAPAIYTFPTSPHKPLDISPFRTTITLLEAFKTPSWGEYREPFASKDPKRNQISFLTSQMSNTRYCLHYPIKHVDPCYSYPSNPVLCTIFHVDRWLKHIKVLSN